MTRATITPTTMPTMVPMGMPEEEEPPEGGGAGAADPAATAAGCPGDCPAGCPAGCVCRNAGAPRFTWSTGMPANKQEPIIMLVLLSERISVFCQLETFARKPLTLGFSQEAMPTSMFAMRDFSL